MSDGCLVCLTSDCVNEDVPRRFISSTTSCIVLGRILDEGVGRTLRSLCPTHRKAVDISIDLEDA